MPHNNRFFYYFCVHLIVNGIFYLLDLKLFYIVDNIIGYLLRNVCWLIHGYIFHFVYIVNYKLDKAPLYSINLLNCSCSIVKLLIICSHVFVNVVEKVAIE